MQQRLPSCLIALIFAKLDDITQMYYLTVSLIPEWLEYIVSQQGPSWFVRCKNRMAWGQVELYRNGHHNLLRQEIFRRGPWFGLFHEIKPYLKDPYHRCLHQFILEQCEIYYTKQPLTSSGTFGIHSEVEQALYLAMDEGGEIDIIKLHCVLPLYTKELVQELTEVAIDKKRTDAVRYLRTVEKRKYAFFLERSYRT